MADHSDQVAVAPRLDPDDTESRSRRIRDPDELADRSLCVELDDQPSSRTTSLQPTMGVGRPFRRIDLCHAKRDFAGIDLLPEPIELLEFLRVGAHKGCCEVDIPLRDALESADGREGPAVTNGGNDKLIEHRSVREAIDSIREVFANARGDIIAPSNHNVGAK